MYLVVPRAIDPKETKSPAGSNPTGLTPVTLRSRSSASERPLTSKRNEHSSWSESAVSESAGTTCSALTFIAAMQVRLSAKINSAQRDQCHLSRNRSRWMTRLPRRLSNSPERADKHLPSPACGLASQSCVGLHAILRRYQILRDFLRRRNDAAGLSWYVVSVHRDPRIVGEERQPA